MAMREMQEITAYHECGHAIMAMSAGFQVSEISCIPSELGLGFTRWQLPSSLTETQRVGAVLTYASGMAADYLHWESQPERNAAEVSDGVTDDQAKARDHLEALGQGYAFEAYVGFATRYLESPTWSAQEEQAFAS